MRIIASVVVLWTMLCIGAGMIVISLIGFFLCHRHKKKSGQKVKLWIKILLWILLIVSIGISYMPATYFYLIISNWGSF